MINEKFMIENHKLGSGSFSEVFLGTDLSNQQKVAIKKISLTQKNNILQKIDQEVSIMQKINHPNIVKYYDVIKSNDYLYIVMEYCNNGSLEDVIKYHEITNNTLSLNREENTYYYLEQLKEALNYIRKYGYIHRDIKPLNVLLTRSTSLNDNKNNFNKSEKLIVKLADFGLATHYHYNEETLLRRMSIIKKFYSYYLNRYLK
jgi:serine/threonine protein kinase